MNSAIGFTSHFEIDDATRIVTVSLTGNLIRLRSRISILKSRTRSVPDTGSSCSRCQLPAHRHSGCACSSACKIN
jgi:hypothetical protein